VIRVYELIDTRCLTPLLSGVPRWLTFCQATFGQ